MNTHTNFHKRSLYLGKTFGKTTHARFPWKVCGMVAVLLFLAPALGLSADPLQPYEQEFVLTAYYSPLPGQCCYIKGGYEADKILNGEGHTAADGTAVYPGMLAAPPEYDFGTIINLPSLGVMEVHDRGGAIQVLDSGAHRLDVWAGHGEEGLARALAFGVKRIKGTVYPVGSKTPRVELSLNALPAPHHYLDDYALSPGLLGVTLKKGDDSRSAASLQNALKQLGYFEASVTGVYGEETQAALSKFLQEHDANEPSDALTVRTAALLHAALRNSLAKAPVTAFVEPGSKGSAVSTAQRILRFLGYYKGKTTGEYDDRLAASILQFQQEHQLVGGPDLPGAGRIGPMTKKAINSSWVRAITKLDAETYEKIERVNTAIKDRRIIPWRYLSYGETGPSVSTLQTLLADRGFFPAEKINGNFGDLTQSALAAYQVDREIVAGSNSQGAGVLGATTLNQLMREERAKALLLVKAKGWKALSTL